MRDRYKAWTTISVLCLVACASCAQDQFFERAGGSGTKHLGPGVAEMDTGPARFVEVLYRAFDTKLAFETVRFMDRYYREPASDGYEVSIDFIKQQLEGAGFGSQDGLELKVLEHQPKHPGWTPRRAKLSMTVPGGEPKTLHGFEEESGIDRVMLPRNAPSANLHGQVAFDLHELHEGQILVTRSLLRRDLINRAARKGAVAVCSASLESYNIDPTGRDRHVNAIQYRALRFAPSLAVVQISPASYDILEEAHLKHGDVELSFESEVEFSVRPVRTLVATVVGRDRANEAVAIVSHVQEPGACDNGTGTGGLLESARSLASLIQQGQLTRPDRSVVFIWGDEMEQSRQWLERTSRRPVAGISSDMTGQSTEKTGAVALLERMPDPGAIEPLPPDKHTPWGSSPVSDEDLVANGLTIIARCAMSDVAAVAGGWQTAEHPWEGGSDHDIFNENGIPAVLFWHFTDFAYHTSLDRLDHVDAEEMRRTGVAILSTALALADPQAEDLGRYLASLEVERELRMQACQRAGEQALEAQWTAWCDGAGTWLVELCSR